MILNGSAIYLSLVLLWPTLSNFNFSVCMSVYSSNCRAFKSYTSQITYPFPVYNETIRAQGVQNTFYEDNKNICKDWVICDYRYAKFFNFFSFIIKLIEVDPELCMCTLFIINRLSEIDPEEFSSGASIRGYPVDVTNDLIQKGISALANNQMVTHRAKSTDSDPTSLGTVRRIAIDRKEYVPLFELTW